MAVITVVRPGAPALQCDHREGETLLEALRRQSVFLTALCAGRGVCGKCRVRVTEGELAPTREDRATLAADLIEAGWRLACTARPEGDLTIALPEDEADTFRVLGAKGSGKRSAGAVRIAIDVGTTTLALALIDARTGSMLDVYTAVNRQRSFGADVISRIEAANNGSLAALRDCIREDLARGIASLLPGGCENLSQIAVAGNTTMLHLLMGHSCRTLGVSPFDPVELYPADRTVRELLGGRVDSDAPARLLPGISTFVGADIVGGLLRCGFDRLEEPWLLIDLGTNGEMALGTKDRLLCTSTAAGPAFEGGNILWGTGGVSGAIDSVSISENRASVTTIGGAPACGICGTGVIGAAAALVESVLVDDTGLLADDYFDEGYPLATAADGRPIVFTQKDVREIQLAKAAVRAGMETLILRAGLSASDIRRVCLAGGFGAKLDVSRAVAIGLLPAELEGVVEAVGNTSLDGAALYMAEADAPGRALALAKHAQELSLAADLDFQRLYVDYMYFE